MQSNELVGCWKHYYEQNSENGEMVYLPCDSITWSISRYRNYFELRPDGEGEYLILSPNDAHHTVPITWIYSASEKHLNLNVADNLISFEVVESGNLGVLVLKEL